LEGSEKEATVWASPLLLNSFFPSSANISDILMVSVAKDLKKQVDKR